MNNLDIIDSNDVSKASKVEEEAESVKPMAKEIFRTKRSYIPVELDKR